MHFQRSGVLREIIKAFREFPVKTVRLWTAVAKLTINLP